MRVWRRPFDRDTIQIPQGEIHILKERCKGCSFCVSYCPKEVMELSDEFNAKGYHLPVVRQAEDCVHCRLCEMLCPEFAIFVTLRDGADSAPETAVASREVEHIAG